METVTKVFDGIQFVVPVNFEFPFDTIKDCPDFCGPTSSILNYVVPEKIAGLKISPCCYIHDICYDISEPIWADFHQSNAVFLTNILVMIQTKPSKFAFVNAVRLYRAATYYNAVSLFGSKIFWRLKKEQEKLGANP